MVTRCILLTVALAASTCAIAQPRVEQWLRGAVQVCTNCHGEAAFQHPVPDSYLVPKLGGQNAAYIEAALKAYRNRSRDHFFMRGIAASFDAQQVKLVAQYFAAPAATSQPNGTKDMPDGARRCLACHGPNATGTTEAPAPVLQGQHQP